MATGPTSFASRLLPVISATIACWALMLSVPQMMRIESGLQRIMAKLCHPKYQHVNGAGTRDQALTLSKIQQPGTVDPAFVIEMGNDPEKIFDTDPLSPSDVAVLLDALKKSGVASVMIGAPMAWPEPDPFAIDALELVMSGFSSCVTSAAVGRGAEPEPMPAAFVRASIPISRVIGSSINIPVVNRVTLADTFLGRENTWAGFSIIESEIQAADRTSLIAHWGDRIIFSSALLAVLVREEIHPEELVIEPGQFIQSPRTGHCWSIDPYGRGILIENAVRAADLQAPQMIRPDQEDLARLQKHRAPVHLLRGQAEALPLARQQQQLLSLYDTPRLLDRITWYRLPLITEWLIVSLLAVQAVVVAGFRKRTRWYCLLILFFFWILALFWGDTWIPFCPLWVALVMTYRTRREAEVFPDSSSPVLVETPTKPQPEAELPSDPVPAKKTSQKPSKKTIRSKKKN